MTQQLSTASIASRYTDFPPICTEIERNLRTKCDRVRGNQAFGHAIHIRVQACIVGMVYFGEFWFFA